MVHFFLPVVLGTGRCRTTATSRSRRRDALSLAGDMMVCYSTAVLCEGPDPNFRGGVTDVEIYGGTTELHLTLP